MRVKLRKAKEKAKCVLDYIVVKLRKILKFLLPIIFAFFVGVYLLQIPNYHGEIQISRKDLGKIIIKRDEHGIPHLKAENMMGSAYALGYIHAQDRLFSITIRKLTYQGRLSQYMGEKAMSMDLLFRSLQLKEIADQTYKELSDDQKAYLQAYSDGINDAVSKMKMLPVEFWLCSIPFNPWTPQDSLGIVRLLSFSLTLGWRISKIRETVKNEFGREFAEEVFQLPFNHLFETVTIITDDELKEKGLYKEFKMGEGNLNDKERTRIKPHKKKPFSVADSFLENSLVELLKELEYVGQGSNSWVIHGNHTVSGKPILANDPHLNNYLPGFWYQQEILIGSNFIIGVSTPGVPSCFIGRTNTLAWGVTVNLRDSSHVYEEKISEDGTKYFYDNEWRPLKLVNLEISIKKQEKFQRQLRMTHRGAILDFLFEGRNVSLSLNTNKVNDGILMMMQNLYTAKNVSDMVSVLSNSVHTSLNFVFADTNGDIGYYHHSKKVIFTNPSDALYFLNGTKAESDPIGFVPKEEEYFVINPSKGYIVTANNLATSENEKYRVNLGIPSTPRSLRITQMIRELIKMGKKISIEDIIKMQLDVKDAYAEVVYPYMIKIVKEYSLYLEKSQQETVQSLLRKMQNWDFNVKADSEAALIFNVWEFLLQNKYFNSFNPEIKERLVHTVPLENFFINRIYLWAEKKISLSEKFCLNEENQDKKDIACAYNIVKALAETNDFLYKYIGRQTDYWNWGALHKNVYKHLPFSQTLLRYVYEIKYPADGNRRTVNVAVPSCLGWPDKVFEYNFEGYHSPNLRFIADLGDDVSKNLWVLDTGVSESIFSRHYDDQHYLHKQGKYLNITAGVDAFENENYHHILTLT